MKNKKLIYATLAALGAQVIFGLSFMMTKIALRFASPMTVIADRYIVAFISLSIAALFSKTKIKVNRNTWKLVIMSAFQPVLYFIFETYGIKLTTSSFSSVMISMIPVVSMVCGIFFLKEVPSPLQYVFTLISIGGVALMSLIGKAEGSVTAAGTLLLVGAVISSAAYNISSRKLSAEFTVFERTYAMTFIGLIVFVIISFTGNINNPIDVISAFKSHEYMLAVLYLGVISSVAAFLLLNYANTHLPVAKTTVFSNLTTVISVVAGAAFLDERVSLYGALSIIMIVSGVLGVQIIDNRKKNL